MLFICKQHCLHKKNFGEPTCDEYLSSCKIKKKEKKKKEKKKKTKNMKNKFRFISGVLCRNTFIFDEFILFCMF